MSIRSEETPVNGDVRTAHTENNAAHEINATLEQAFDQVMAVSWAKDRDLWMMLAGTIGVAKGLSYRLEIMGGQP